MTYTSNPDPSYLASLEAEHAIQAAKPQITLTNAHGTFTTTPAELDLTIQRYANISRTGLWTVMEEVNGEADYSDVHSVSEFLVMLSDAGQY